MKALRLIPVVLAAAALVSGAAAGTSGLPQQSGAVDLSRQANLEITGAAAGDAAGTSVAAIGDMNGDGRGDVVVGVPGADVNGRVSSGSAYGVFGRETSGRLSLFSVNAGIEAGIRIDGANVEDNAGYDVSGAGDVNGDGRPDVVVGAPNASNNSRRSSGSAYVVFGTNSPGAIDLTSLGDRGFRIDGAGEGDWAGNSVAGVGDVNGDRLSDVVIGARYSSRNDRPYSGSAYVVFGSASTATVDLASLGDRGFRIDGATSYGYLGSSVAGVGDLNGDARPDLLVGAPWAEVPGRNSAGSAYVVFGAASSASVDVAALGERGVRIAGADGDLAGWSVAGAGDVDGDRKEDVVVGSPHAKANDRPYSGSAYVVFGKALNTDVDLAALGDGGFRVDGGTSWAFAAESVSAVGDVNGDGRSDLVVGSSNDLNNGRVYSGSAHVVFGRASSAAVDLAALGDAGFRVDGAAAYDAAATSVAAAGDVNGDGRDDLLVGAPGFDSLGMVDTGAAFAVYGFGKPELAYDPIVTAAGTAMAARAEARQADRDRLVRRLGSAAGGRPSRPGNRHRVGDAASPHGRIGILDHDD